MKLFCYEKDLYGYGVFVDLFFCQVGIRKRASRKIFLYFFFLHSINVEQFSVCFATITNKWHHHIGIKKELAGSMFM
jgi:hypothetical protein